MKFTKLSFCFTLAAATMLAGSATATPMPPLAMKNGCSGCHSIDRQLVGPAWTDVAKKYKGDKKAAANLAAKIKSGGKGVWGPGAMPPQKASEEDVKELVKFILSLAK